MVVKRGLILLLALGLVTACTSSRGTRELSIKSWAARGIDASAFKVFEWKPGSDGGFLAASTNSYGPLIDRVRRAIINELESRGYRMAVNAQPDFWVSFEVAMTSANRGTPNAGAPGSMNPMPLGSGYERTGFMMISIGVPGRKDPVWTGTASGQSPRLLLRHMQIKDAVHRILTQFPPL